MKIVLVDNLLLDWGGSITRDSLKPHLGLISLAAVAEALGHTAVVLDPKLGLLNRDFTWDADVYRQIARWIMQQSPDCVGFTSLGCNFICTAKVAKYVKDANPDIPVLLGGPHATILDREILSTFTQFDIIARGECEPVLPSLLSSLPRGRFEEVPGVTFRRADQILVNPSPELIMDLDTLPMPVYSKYPIEDLGLKSLRVEAGRGCPFACTFCSTAPFFGRRFRLKSAPRLVSELDLLNERYGIADFSLTHDLFTVNRVKVIEFCELVKDRNYTWGCSARMDCVDNELLQIMAGAGCRAIYFGVETGSRSLQSVVKKRLDLDLFTPILNESLRMGLETTVSFITGFPDEQHDDQLATLDLLGDCFIRPYADQICRQLHLLTPEPGTELYQKYRGQMKYDGYISDQNFPSMEPDDGQVMSDYPGIFMTHHYFPTKLSRQRNVFVTSAVHSLNRAGTTVVAHTLNFFGCKMSALIMHMFEWAAAQGIDGACDDDVVVRFIESFFGADHYLKSVFSYMYLIRSLGGSELTGEYELANFKKVDRVSSKSNWDPETTYRLSRQAALMRNSHNCAAIISALTDQHLKSEDLDPTITAHVSDFVIVADPSNSRQCRSFELSTQARILLELFEQPLSITQCCNALAAADQTGELEHFLMSLVGSEILEPVNMLRSQTRVSSIN